jgi:hypothetical protein
MILLHHGAASVKDITKGYLKTCLLYRVVQPQYPVRQEDHSRRTGPLGSLTRRGP